MNRKITALRAQKRNRQRVNVYLDGEFAFGLSRIVAAWLQVGQELSEEKISVLQAEDSREVAYQRALKLLNYRIRSEAEIRKNLREHGLASQVIDEVLERLQQNGFVDDRHFAKAWIENRAEYRPRGRALLAFELRQKGVPDEVIDESLSDLDEEGGAYQAGSKYARKLRDLERPEFRRKLYGFLSRRGFSYNIIAPVVDRIWAECESGKPAGDNLTNNEEVNL